MESLGRGTYTQVLLEGVPRTLDAFKKGRRRGMRYEMVMSKAKKGKPLRSSNLRAAALQTDQTGSSRAAKSVDRNPMIDS